MMCTAETDHITATEFQEWVAAGQPGQRIAYARGALAASIHIALQEELPDAQKLSALQEATWRAGAKGQVYLVQRRLKAGAFKYLAERAPEERRLRDELRWLQSRYDDGKMSPAVFAVVKSIETKIRARVHAQQENRRA